MQYQKLSFLILHAVFFKLTTDNYLVLHIKYSKYILLNRFKYFLPKLKYHFGEKSVKAIYPKSFFEDIVHAMCGNEDKYIFDFRRKDELCQIACVFGVVLHLNQISCCGIKVLYKN